MPRPSAADGLFNPTFVKHEQVLGSGGFAKVYLGVHQTTGEQVAVKVFEHRSEGRGGGTAADLAREVAVLARLVHPRVVRYLGSHIDAAQGRALLYLELMTGGSLASLLQNNGGRLWEDLVRRAVRDAAEGLGYLHLHDVIHRDVKPHNLLIDTQGRVKVADFGCCKHLCDRGHVSTAGHGATPRYMAPEAVHGRESPASDIWSLAVTAAELASGRPPWEDAVAGGGDVALIFHIGMGAGRDDHHPALPATLSPAACEALAACFAGTPSRRPSCATLLQTDFLRDVDTPLAGAETIEAYAASRGTGPAGGCDAVSFVTLSVPSTAAARGGARGTTRVATALGAGGPAASSAMGLTTSRSPLASEGGTEEGSVGAAPMHPPHGVVAQGGREGITLPMRSPPAPPREPQPGGTKSPSGSLARTTEGQMPEQFRGRRRTQEEMFLPAVSDARIPRQMLGVRPSVRRRSPR